MAKVTEVLPYSKEKIWQVVTDNQGQYRTDIRAVEHPDQDHFIYYSYDQVKTEYHILQKEPYQLYKIAVSGKFGRYVFTIRLSPLDDHRTEVSVEQEEGEKQHRGFLWTAFFVDPQKMLYRYLYELKQNLKNQEQA